MTNQKYRRDGNNIYTTVEIDFTEAILGIKREIKTLTKSVLVTIAPGTQSGTKLRLKGQGLSVDGQAGDLIAEIIVTIPQSVTEEQKEILRSWNFADRKKP